MLDPFKPDLLTWRARFRSREVVEPVFKNLIFNFSLCLQEMNYGARFPTAFVWSQGISDGGTTQLVLTGGKLLGLVDEP